MVPSNSKVQYNANNVAVGRFYNLSGGDYWGKLTENNVCRSLREIFGNKYSSGFSEGEIRCCLNRVIGEFKENTAVIYTEISFKLIKDGTFNDLNNYGFAQVGETIAYTLLVVNTGKTPIDEIEIIDPLLNGTITSIPVKSERDDTTLKGGQTWTYTVIYSLTKQDITNKGVYNQAIVKGKDIFTGEVIEETSSPTIPLKPNDPGYDATKSNHTYVALPTKTLLITNPMVCQRMK